MIEKRGNRTWYRAVKSYFKLGKKGRVSHVVATLAACLTIGGSTPAMAAWDGDPISVEKTDTQQNGYQKSMGFICYNLTITDTGSITVTDRNAVESNPTSGLGDAAITNNGAITVTNTAASGVSPVSGIYVNNILDNGKVINNGTITVDNAKAGANVYVFGINVNARINDTNTVENSGTISLTNSGDDVGMNGIFAKLDGSASLTNAGTVELYSSGSASMFGMSTSVDPGATVENSGTISLTGGDISRGAGIWAYDDADGRSESQVINSGTISLDVTSALSLTGIQDTTNGKTTNTDIGRISVKAETASALAGIQAFGEVENKGTITVSAGQVPRAFGVYTKNADDDIASVTNSGTITVTADSVSDCAAGISGAAHTLNKDKISVSATTNGGVKNPKVLGIQANGSVRNTEAGTISVTAGSESGYAAAITGILVNQIEENGSVINAGTITVDNAKGRAQAYGINITDAINGTNTVENAGTIEGESSGNGILKGMKMKVTSGGGVTNSGTIILTADELTSGAGIYAYDSGAAGLTDSRVVNSGSIALSATTSAQNLIGIADRTMGKTINKGTISVSSGLGNDHFSGIYASGEVENSGTITVTEGQHQTVKGIFTKNGNYDITKVSNSGTITVTADTVYNYAAGISGDPDVENSGTVTASLTSGDLDDSFYSVKTTGTLANLSGGTLKGRLSAGSTTNAGTIKLSPGSSNIDGNFTQKASGILGIILDSDPDNGIAMQHSTLAVTGTATLANGSGIYVDVKTASENQELLIGKTLEGVVTTGGGITTTPDALDVTDNSALLDFTASLSNSDTCLDLDAVKAVSMEDAADQGGQSGASDAGSVLDDLSGDDTGKPDDISGDDAGKPDDISEDDTGEPDNLSGAPSGAAIALRHTNSQLNPQISGFISYLNTLPTTGQVAQALVQAAPMTSGSAVSGQLSAAMGAVVRSRQGGLAGLNSGDGVFSDRNLWVKPFAAFMDQEDDNGARGFSADVFGIGLGADGEISSGDRLGLALLVSRAKAETNATPQSSDMDGASLMAYGDRGLARDLTLFWQLGGGIQDTETSRYISGIGATAEADYTASNLFASARALKAFHMQGDVTLSFGPALSYTWLHTPSYSEAGAGGMNLAVEGSNTQSLVAALEGGLSRAVGKDIDINATASLGYDLIDDDAAVTSRFQGGGTSFITQGIDNAPVVFTAGLGVSRQFSDRFSLDADYDMEGRGSDLLTHTISCRFNWTF